MALLARCFGCFSNREELMPQTYESFTKDQKIPLLDDSASESKAVQATLGYVRKRSHKSPIKSLYTRSVSIQTEDTFPDSSISDSSLVDKSECQPGFSAFTSADNGPDLQSRSVGGNSDTRSLNFTSGTRPHSTNESVVDLSAAVAICSHRRQGCSHIHDNSLIAHNCEQSRENPRYNLVSPHSAAIRAMISNLPVVIVGLWNQ